MLSRRSIACCATVFGLALGAGSALAADATITHTRSATFELTFNNSDVEWSGVPGSPAATLRVREGATPIATDLCVTTVTSDPMAPRRRY
ncbi:MAG: hypothetical protein KDA63_20920, partial [Planctomycetales bacterium]|nr:hypothetical protein [Planctomycetales bacterium]